MKIFFSDSRGITLIETLIALLVLSAGIYAMLALQLASMKTTRNAYYRTQAQITVRSAAEQLLVDPGLTGNEQEAWVDAITDQLPSGSGILCRDASPDDGSPSAPACNNEGDTAPYFIKVWWADSSAGNSGGMVNWSVSPY